MLTLEIQAPEIRWHSNILTAGIFTLCTVVSPKLLTHSPLNHPRSTSILPLVTPSVLMVKDKFVH